MQINNKKIAVWLILSLIVLSAFFLRIHKIDSIPSGIYPDESVNGTDAQLANATNDHRWFYTNNYGREGLFMNLISASIRILGNTILGLKFWSILFGTLTVLGAYLLVKELFRSERSGLIAAFMLAFSFWSINFSRISFRAIMVPFILTFSFYFLFRGIRTRHYFNFIAAGFIFGTGFHTYIAFRVAPLILVILLAAFIVSRKKFLQEYWKQIIVFSAAVVIAVSPMIYTFLKHPEYLESRSNAISVLSPEVNHGHLASTFAKSLGLSFVKYNFWGDQNWRHNYPPYPILNPIVGISFLIGIAYLIFKAVHLSVLRFKYKIYDDKLAVYIFLLGWFLTMLIPEFLTAEGLPHALRSIGTMPVAFIFATIPILWVFGKTDKAGYFFKASVISLFVLIFASIGISETLKYFVFWANNPNQHGQFNESYKNMAIYLNSLPPDINKYVFANGSGREMEDGLPVSAHVIKYLTYEKSKKVIFLKRGAGQTLERPFILIPMSYDQNVISKMKEIFPDVKIERMDVRPGYASDFISIIVK